MTTLLPAIGLYLAACQVPYGTPRQALVGDRVAAITLHAESEGWRAAAWRVEDGQPWTDELPNLAWSWVGPTDDVDALTEADAVAIGPWPLLSAPDANPPLRLALVARFPSGFEERAVLDVPGAAAAELGAITLSILPDRPLGDATEEHLNLEARVAELAQNGAFVPEQTWARLSLDTSAHPAPNRLRWMATGGTFLELDATQTDWAPSTLVLDDLDVEESAPLAPGTVTVLALGLDGTGANAARATDLWVGPPSTGVWLEGRFLPTDAPVASGLASGRLEPDDDSPTGLRWVDVTPAELDSSDDPYATRALPCAGPTDGPFNPSWLFDGRCTRQDVVGAVVVGVVP